MDERLSVSSVSVNRVISWHWSYLTCVNEDGTTLHDEIGAAIRRPIVADGFRWTSGGTAGLPTTGTT